TLHTLYFPGWVGYVDGEAHPLSPIERSGYILLQGVPAGAHTIDLRYEGTVVQHVATWASAVAAAALLLAAIAWRGKARSRQAAGYPAARWWLPLAFVFLVAIKAFVIDEETTWLRWRSTCSSVHGAEGGLLVQFGERVQLCGIDMPDRAYRPGDRMRITLYWQATDAVEEPADSFVHLLGATFNPRTGNPLWGQQDKQSPGYHPLTQWTPGKLYRDRYEFLIDPDAPAGEYQLEIGWVERSTGQRLIPQVVGTVLEVSVSHLDSLVLGGIEVH
ncbi:MAG: hypothetical protein ACP5JJ_11165, partial [Anaerolineae bacterium]